MACGDLLALHAPLPVTLADTDCCCVKVEKLRQEKLRLAEELRQKKAALKAKAMQKPKMNAPATGAGPTASGAGVQVALAPCLH